MEINDQKKKKLNTTPFLVSNILQNLEMKAFSEYYGEKKSLNVNSNYTITTPL